MRTLTTQMKSVGEVMAMGRTFQESFQKALRGSGNRRRRPDRALDRPRRDHRAKLGEPGPERILYVGDAFRLGMTLDEIFEETEIDPWFLVQIEEIVDTEQQLDRAAPSTSLSAAELRFLKKKGFSDKRLGKLLGSNRA